MKVIFHLEVGIKRRADGIDGVDLVTPPIEMEILPARHQWIVALAGDDYRIVEAVHIMAHDRSEPLHVFFSSQGRGKLRALKKLGWKEEA